MKYLVAFLLLVLPASAYAELNSNLISYWKLDEASGNPADSVGTNTLTNTNTVTFVSAKINNGSHHIAASSQYFTIADNASLSPTGDISIALWYKPADTCSAEEELVAKYINAGQKSYRLYCSAGLNFQTTSDGTTGVQASATQTFVSGTWYFIVVTKSGTAAQFYVNGAAITTTGTVSSTIFDGTDAFRIGTRVAAADFANGDIDEVGLWSRTLSAAEVQNLYRGGAGCQYRFSICSFQFWFNTFL